MRGGTLGHEKPRLSGWIPRFRALRDEGGSLARAPVQGMSPRVLGEPPSSVPSASIWPRGRAVPSARAPVHARRTPAPSGTFRRARVRDSCLRGAAAHLRGRPLRPRLAPSSRTAFCPLRRRGRAGALPRLVARSAHHPRFAPFSCPLVQGFSRGLRGKHLPMVPPRGRGRRQPRHVQPRCELRVGQVRIRAGFGCRTTLVPRRGAAQSCYGHERLGGLA
mmetsp:Transcript_41990/g.115883  ORF Transcript_41990/g.115883 Transcript_41990/m.115883 type:complete len:220 (-) Transcript_41990:560-1219(-)